MFNPANEISSINFGSIIGGALNAVVNAQKESAETTVNFVRRVGFMPGETDPKTGKEIGIGKPINVSFTYDKEVSPAQNSTATEYQISVVTGGSGYNDKSKIKLTIDDKKLDAKVELENGAITSVKLNADPPEGATEESVINVSEEGNDDVTPANLKLNVTNAPKNEPAQYQTMKIDVPILTMMPIPFIKIDYTDIEFNVKINSVSTTKSSDTSNTSVTSNTTAGYKSWWGLKADTTLNASFSNQKSSSSSENVKKDYSLNIKVHAVQDDIPAGMSRILDILEDNISMKAIPESATKTET